VIDTAGDRAMKVPRESEGAEAPKQPTLLVVSDPEAVCDEP